MSFLRVFFCFRHNTIHHEHIYKSSLVRYDSIAIRVWSLTAVVSMRVLLASRAVRVRAVHNFHLTGHTMAGYTGEALRSSELFA